MDDDFLLEYGQFELALEAAVRRDIEKWVEHDSASGDDDPATRSPEGFAPRKRTHLWDTERVMHEYGKSGDLSMNSAWLKRGVVLGFEAAVAMFSPDGMIPDDSG